MKLILQNGYPYPYPTNITQQEQDSLAEAAGMAYCGFIFTDE